MTVSFTQKLRIVEDISLINDDVFELKFVPDESNLQEESYFTFTWSVTDFEEYNMNIQVEFRDIYYISDGQIRDKLVATVRNSTFFFSGDALMEIPSNSQDEIKVPR